MDVDELKTLLGQVNRAGPPRWFTAYEDRRLAHPYTGHTGKHLLGMVLWRERDWLARARAIVELVGIQHLAGHVCGACAPNCCQPCGKCRLEGRHE